MKRKTTALLIALAAGAFVCLAQDTTPPAPEPANPAQTEPAPPPPAPPAPAPQPTPPVSPAAPAPAVEPPAPPPVPPASPTPFVNPVPVKARTPEQPGETPPANNLSAEPKPPAIADPTPVAAAESKPAAAAEPKSAAADPAKPAAPAAPADAPAPGASDVVPLIVIDEVPLTDAIRNLARQSSLNFQFDPRITSSNQPTVSIRFENVTAQEALVAVLDNYNLALQKDPKSKIARVTIKDSKAAEPLISRIVQLKYSDPSNLVTVVRTTLSERSTVVPDPRTGQLIINTTEREMEDVTQLIDKLDTPARQVLIESHILETAHNPSTIKGIDWSGTLEAQRLNFGNNLQQKPVTDEKSVNRPLASEFPKVLVDTAKGFNPATAFLDADGVSAVLSFLNKDSDTEVVATPRAVTMDNQTAQLSVTRAFPIFQVTPGSANSPAGATVTYTNLGTILFVTPRIAADKNISLKVTPEVSNIDSVDRQVVNGQLNTANIYAIRRIDTSVMIPSGNTLVMGGLMNDTKTKGYTKVPVLGDIPLAGGLFRSESKKRSKSNLIIFITPTVLDEGDFHQSAGGKEYMQTRYSEAPETKDTAWDSAKPHDWTKPVR